MSLALSAGVKTTSTLLVIPWILVILFSLLKARQGRFAAILILESALLGFLVNFLHFWRVLSQNTGPLTAATDVLNNQISTEVLCLNLIRDLASSILLPLPFVVSDLQIGVEAFSRLLGWHPSLPAATFGSGFSLPTAWSEDHAAAPWHMGLLVVATIWLLVRERRQLKWAIRLIVVVACLQLLFIAAAIRWQPWINRFTFLIVVFASPLIGLLVSRWPRVLRVVTVALLVLAGLAWVVFQPLRGLAGTAWLSTSFPGAASLPRYDSPLTFNRFEQFFMHHPTSATTYADAIRYASQLNPNSLVLDLKDDWWEFPLWAWPWIGNIPRITHSTKEANGRTVVICSTPCDVGQLSMVRTFHAEGPSSPSVAIGPTLVVGLDKAG
jgi:hypothetical protein